MSTSTDKLAKLFERITSEHVILLSLIVVGSYAYWKAGEFTYGGRVFPRLSAGIVVVGSILVLFQDYLPNSIQAFISSSIEFTDEESVEDDVTQEESDLVDRSHARFQKPLSPVLFTSLMILLYTIVGWAIGFLWISPLFAAAYTYWFDKHWIYVVVIAILAFLVSYTFISVFGIRLHEGELVTIGEDIAPATIVFLEGIVVEKNPLGGLVP